MRSPRCSGRHCTDRSRSTEPDVRVPATRHNACNCWSSSSVANSRREQQIDEFVGAGLPFVCIE